MEKRYCKRNDVIGVGIGFVNRIIQILIFVDGYSGRRFSRSVVLSFNDDSVEEGEFRLVGEFLCCCFIPFPSDI